MINQPQSNEEKVQFLREVGKPRSPINSPNDLSSEMYTVQVVRDSFREALSKDKQLMNNPDAELYEVHRDDFKILFPDPEF